MEFEEFQFEENTSATKQNTKNYSFNMNSDNIDKQNALYVNQIRLEDQNNLSSSISNPEITNSVQYGTSGCQEAGLDYLQQACFYLDPNMGMEQEDIEEQENELVCRKCSKNIQYCQHQNQQQLSSTTIQLNNNRNRHSSQCKKSENQSNQNSSLYLIDLEEQGQFSNSLQIANINKQRERDISYQLIDTLRFQQYNLFELFCDVPFSLDYYIKEVESGQIRQRNCIYNTFKKIVEVRSFQNGMMIEATLQSKYTAANKFNFLVDFLESKGNNQLLDLAFKIQNFQDRVNQLTQEASLIINQINSSESKKSSASQSKKCYCSIYDQTCMCYSNKHNMFPESDDESSSYTSLIQECYNNNNNNIDSREIDLNFMKERLKASYQVKDKILSSQNPLDFIYFKTYVIDWQNNGNLKIDSYGFTKGYCELMGLTINEYKQHILRKGFMENVHYDCKVKFMFPYFTNYPWSVKEEGLSRSGEMIFTTHDNIVFTGNTTVETHNLSYEFDKQHNFNTKLCNTLLFVRIDVEEEDLLKIYQIRRSRGTRSIFDDKDDEECDFYYSQESQSFLERYYKDIYGPQYAEKKQLRRCEYVEIPQHSKQQKLTKYPFKQTQLTN
ncbi:hypothetical protein TTHERM_00678110 (macronuclear) [Tetrahymena thermophila SB210]|uniref:Uncharacterized protein n=1 Tax=Tetrahymena thermophila (strain SB210) TaxID=312017 RepID=I7MMY9_TETTS|nr:hypothetical protein TTHERM_00678110 [Tetrahymena thermophila SB210]EAS07545.1 hypothetical protein TTHERM_00678110 [Tetrahymena thermophila SB210]|eukprot:XP_001027787.1 hypothetical protein TTHERM_00678110 [Tetrahymena thermophila SB210]